MLLFYCLKFSYRLTILYVNLGLYGIFHINPISCFLVKCCITVCPSVIMRAMEKNKERSFGDSYTLMGQKEENMIKIIFFKKQGGVVKDKGRKSGQ